jgi:hypothetical protein
MTYTDESGGAVHSPGDEQTSCSSAEEGVDVTTTARRARIRFIGEVMFVRLWR